MKAAVTVKENHVFRRIYRKGQSSVQPALVVYYQKNRQGKTRLGVTVSTKLHLPAMKKGYDVILVGRVKAVHTPYSKLDKQYGRALEALGLLEPKE